jgi:dGTPase
VSRHDGRAQHVVTALFGAYYKNPRLLPDYVLLRYKEIAGVPYLRDVPLKHIDAEITANYHKRPLFLRCIADHLAGMTDSYAVADFDSLFASYPRRMPGLPG